MSTKVQFIRKVHNTIEINPKKYNWKGVKQTTNINRQKHWNDARKTTKYKQTKKLKLKWNLIYDEL